MTVTGFASQGDESPPSSQTGPDLPPWHRAKRASGIRGLVTISLMIGSLGPYVLLGMMSLGSGWTFPRWLPDQIDGRPWGRLLTERDGLLIAVMTSLLLSGAVGVVATGCGWWIGRAVRRSRAAVWRYLLYLPFVTSPVVMGATLFDLLVRGRLAGSWIGVALVQILFATSFAAIFFCESWTAKGDRLEQLVRTLGGNECAVWRHAIWPRTRGLLIVCFLQTALYSWVDYGLVAIVGGGQIQTITMRLFAYLREANVNQAAMAAIVLVTPAILAALASGVTTAADESRAERKSFLREF
jgi:putative spermidine/putrescine transport system permease protein